MTLYQVTIGDKTALYPEGTPYGKIVERYESEYPYPIILVKANGRLRELHKTLTKDVVLEPVLLNSEIGHKTYKRSMSLLFLKAMYHVVGIQCLEQIFLHFSVSSGFYYKVKGNVKLTEDLLAQVKTYMWELIERKTPIYKRSVSTDEAVELFHKHGMYDKEKLFGYRRGSKVNIYRIGEYEDYNYGFMTWHTGYLKYFELYLYEDGIVLQMPEQRNPFTVPPFLPSPKIFQVQMESEDWASKLELETVGDLNEKITQGDARSMILVSEALQEGRIAKIAETIKEHGNVKFVMIAGPSSSGKTTFSQRLSVQLFAHGLKPHYIGVDNYFVNRDQTPLDEHGNKNYECLEAIDVNGFNEDMTRLLNGETVDIPVYNFISGKREYKGNYLTMGQEDILVIEGIHGLNDDLSYSLPKDSKFKIYISALTQLNIDEHNRIPTTDGRLLRRIVRDARTRGTSASATLNMWNSVRRGEEEYIFPNQESADVMFNSALIYELSVLKQYAEPALFQVKKDDPAYPEAKRLLKFLDYFLGIPSEDVPTTSILKEFIGGGCFKL